MERSLVLIKPDGVQRGLMGDIIRRLEQRGLKLVAAKFLLVPRELAEKHYAIHKGKAFYNDLLDRITSAPVLALVWEGAQVVSSIRQTVGSTNPANAEPGTIRHDLGLSTEYNLVHASDSPENGEFEVALWFSPADLVSWKRDTDRWIYP
ncbi:MAG: nucleoside-diphosphate kinase [Anaerolineaceae bacterium]|nr:nucleoside-diphosphate kinase [Anaerolineaceae bacterium]MBN2678189.1 nucleoside-diphosphate kinase [Anaerolineaceae bacterium]